ncbi:hypothetical protein NV379_17250 [Paenibacillus sp. N1-5-1-14]|uniref:hypothetical protein n=1 Tax=Paenibacillus radicibacter TaxID=2972488 RepID=UPI00215947C7|nr:hypothetical protein [Paenibacillus radicibacter]MCR8644403.1 hypothetical protein [Paenibacillus radicibacter]
MSDYVKREYGVESRGEMMQQETNTNEKKKESLILKLIFDAPEDFAISLLWVALTTFVYLYFISEEELTYLQLVVVGLPAIMLLRSLIKGKKSETRAFSINFTCFSTLIVIVARMIFT